MRFLVSSSNSNLCPEEGVRNAHSMKYRMETMLSSNSGYYGQHHVVRETKSAALPGEATDKQQLDSCEKSEPLLYWQQGSTGNYIPTLWHVRVFCLP